jgi:hypothetical protein
MVPPYNDPMIKEVMWKQLQEVPTIFTDLITVLKEVVAGFSDRYHLY